MRYRLKLVSFKNNYIRLPADSPLRQAIAQSESSAQGSSGLEFYFESERSHCSSIKVQSLSSGAFPAYFGFVGGTSSVNTVEISREAGLALGLENDMLVSCQVEYSYTKLQSLEMEPATPEDFELVEQHSSQIEEQLLNQVGVFYRGQTFVLFLGQQGTVVRLRSIVDGRQSSNCFYLTEACELHIAAKVRPKNQKGTLPVQQEAQQEPEQKQTTGFKVALKDDQQSAHGLINLDRPTTSIVKVTFESKPSIADLDFKDFARLRQQKSATEFLGTQKRELYFQVQNTDQTSFSFCTFAHQFNPKEVVLISAAPEPPFFGEIGITVQFQTSHALIRQAAQQQNQELFDILTDLFRRYLLTIVDQREITRSQLLVNDQSLFVLDDLQFLLSQSLEELEAESQKTDKAPDTKLLQKIMIVKRLIQTSKSDSVAFTVCFEHRSQVTLAALQKPKYVLLTRGNIDQFLSKSQVGFNPQQREIVDEDQTDERSLMTQLYGKQARQLQTEQTFLLYGPIRVGKTFLVKQLQAEVIDCTQMGSLVSSIESIETMIEYLQLRVDKILDDPSPSKLLVFDSVQAIAPKKDDSIGVVNIIKSERVTQWLCGLVDELEIRIGLVARHYSLVNQKLLDIGYFDNLVELPPPNKEQRYAFVKSQIAAHVDSRMQTPLSQQEIILQQLSQLTEYFQAADLAYLLR